MTAENKPHVTAPPTKSSVSPPDLSRYTNKTILITGGASGIGWATAQLLHSLGNNVVILDRAAPVKAAETESLLLSSRFLLQRCDITSWPSQRAAFDAAVGRFGGVDAVYVNAGIAEYREQFFNNSLDNTGKLSEPDRRTIDIDLQAANDTVKLAIYWMREDAKHGKGRGGSIVMTASLAGYLASAGMPLYSAAKHGIVGLMRALKNDVSKVGIAVSVVAPSVTITPFLAQDSKALPDIDEWAAMMRQHGVAINKAETVALAVVHLMCLGKVTGKVC